MFPRCLTLIPQNLTGRSPKLHNFTSTRWILNLPTVFSLLDTLTGISNWYKKGDISDLNFTVSQFCLESVQYRLLCTKRAAWDVQAVQGVCHWKGHALNCEGEIKCYVDSHNGNTFHPFCSLKQRSCIQSKRFCYNVYAEDDQNKSWQSKLCHFPILEYSTLQS